MVHYNESHSSGSTLRGEECLVKIIRKNNRFKKKKATKQKVTDPSTLPHFQLPIFQDPAAAPHPAEVCPPVMDRARPGGEAQADGGPGTGASHQPYMEDNESSETLSLLSIQKKKNPYTFKQP